MTVQLHPSFREENSQVLAEIFTEDLHLVESDSFESEEFVSFFATLATQKGLDIEIFVGHLAPPSRTFLRKVLEGIERSYR